MCSSDLNVSAAIEADIGITEIINQKDDDVGATCNTRKPRVRLGRGRLTNQQLQQSDQEYQLMKNACGGQHEKPCSG